MPPRESPETIARGRVLARRLDGGAHLRAHHHVRYQVYCLDQGFVPAENCPDELEIDKYDAQSAHFGVFLDKIGSERMIATSRLVRGKCRFPLHNHCQVFPDYTRYFEYKVRAAEISRLTISRTAIANLAGRDDIGQLRKDILVALFKAMYLWVKAEEISLLFAAMEAPLARNLRHTGFPFLQIGPEADYYGRVFPYVLDIEFACHYLRSRKPEIWNFFVEGQPICENSQRPAYWLSRPAKRA